MLKSVYDRKRGYSVHKRVADLSGLSDEIAPAIEKMPKAEQSLAEMNARHEYAVTMPDRNQAGVPDLPGIETDCGGDRPKRSSLSKKAHNST